MNFLTSIAIVVISTSAGARDSANVNDAITTVGTEEASVLLASTKQQRRRRPNSCHSCNRF